MEERGGGIRGTWDLSGLAERGKDGRCKVQIKVINGQVHKSKPSGAMIRR